jgi:SAM-dependent methyltransferase
MPGLSGIVFGAKNLEKADIKGKRVLDVGSYDFNGSLRPLIESWEPTEYIGVDLLTGPSVDVVCSAEDLVQTFGKESFDVVISTEMLEHARHWRVAISNLKNVCKPEGIILLTTRSYGYPYHGYPNDFWRYEIQDMKLIFSDCKILALEKDYLFPGVFIKLQKPINFIENDLSPHQLYSMILNRATQEITDPDFQNSYFRRLVLKYHLKLFVSQLTIKSGKLISKLFKI